MGKGPQKVNIPMAAALILLSLTTLSICWTSGLYARYYANNSASDSARVAKFQVSGTMGKNITIDCQDTEPGTYAITVENQSEVAVEYALTVEFEEEIPADTLEVKLDKEDGVWSQDRKSLAFGDVGQLSPNDGMGTHSLSFGVLKWTYVTDEVTGENKAEKKLDFTVHLTVEQID